MSFKVGDDVRVFLPSYQRSRHAPEGGYPGVVTKVARKYGTATYREGSTVEFDLETGVQRGSESTYATMVKTPRMVNLERREAQALAAIRDAGLEFRFGFKKDWTLERLEALAELLESFD